VQRRGRTPSSSPSSDPSAKPVEPNPENAPDLDPQWVARIREHLARWYEAEHRPLPWREDRDPYRILVSEMMLVQTTVAAVIPYFHRFLERFPTVEALASADEAAVLKAWEGLGYYRRARQLHKAARAVVAEHSGVFPTDPEDIRALPGVGRYIAGAIRSFAFDQPAPIVEANTQRVLSRWLAWREDLKSKESQTRLWEAAERLVPAHGAGLFNQGFMELGALICTPRAPACLVCPVSSDCLARAQGIQDQLPVVAPKPPPLEVEETAALILRDDQILVVQRGPNQLWEHFWEFPTIHRVGVDPAGRGHSVPADPTEGFKAVTGVSLRLGPLVQTVRYSVTRHRVRLDAYAAQFLEGSPRPGAGLVQADWAKPASLTNVPFSSAGRKLLSWVIKHEAELAKSIAND